MITIIKKYIKKLKIAIPTVNNKTNDAIKIFLIKFSPLLYSKHKIMSSVY